MIISETSFEGKNNEQNAQNERHDFDAVILVTPDSFKRLSSQYRNYLKYMPVRNIYILGNSKVGELLQDCIEQIASGEDKSRLRFIDEDDILPFNAVHEVIRMEMADILQGRELPRGITGWYYQQFLKLSYAYRCEDEYYLIWDGDTFPCCRFSMFSDPASGTGITQPYLDVKKEEHADYFKTMGILIPGMEKVIGPSFISEHMLFKKDIVVELLEKIESNNEIEGNSFWEKVIHAIGSERIQNSSFSEYETYGTYIALRHPSEYRIREWHSFRLGGEFFDPDTISERDYEWLGKDFTAISFEKDQSVREDHKNLFDNPEYQQKLSAKKMLQVAQEAFDDGYIESWDEDDNNINVSNGEFDDSYEDEKDREETSVGNTTLSMIQHIRDLFVTGNLKLSDIPIDDICEAVRIEVEMYRNTFLPEQYDDVLSSFERICSMSEHAREDFRLASMFFESMIMCLLSVSDAVKSLANRDYWEYKHREEINDPEIQEIISEIQRRGDIRLLNYRFVDDYLCLDAPVGYDEDSGMHYVLHNGKKMYFPENWTEQSIADYYLSTVSEQDDRSPHCYQKDGYNVNVGDVLVDAGAAEGIFTLDRIDAISKAYIIDADPEWIKALERTFQPYKDKVEIIYGYLNSNTDEDHNIALNDILAGKTVDYIKMDIEGYEKAALSGAEEIFRQNRNMRCAICSYHCREDEKWITQFLEGIGYETAHSDGYICPDWNIEGRLDAELRRGVVFGRFKG